MRYHVKRKQPNSKLCLVCGLKNASGLKASFYELEGERLLAVFTPSDEHQSYPGRLHGGIVSAVLDETIGRAIMLGKDGSLWGVTLELNTRFKKPLPLGEELRVVARIDKENRRAFEGSGEILLPDGSVAATGWGKYLKLPIEKIADFDTDVQEWKVVPATNDPESVEL